MNYAEFKAKAMNAPNFGKEPAEWSKLSSFLPKLKPANQAELIAAVLQAGEAGLVKVENSFAFAPLASLKDTQSQEVVPSLIKLVEDPAVSEKDVKAIFTSPWMATLSSNLAEREAWLFAHYNFPKHYGVLFIDALKAKRPFGKWRNVPYPITAKTENAYQLKPLLLRVLEIWPTGGRSGYALLTELREVEAVKSLADDKDIAAAFDNVEGHCDFGSLEKVRAALKEK